MDRDGYISNGELFLVLKMMVGNNLKDGQLQQIVDKTIMEADKDGDGKLSFDEFVQMVSNTVRVPRRYRSDANADRFPPSISGHCKANDTRRSLLIVCTCSCTSSVSPRLQPPCPGWSRTMFCASDRGILAPRQPQLWKPGSFTSCYDLSYPLTHIFSPCLCDLAAYNRV